MQGAMDSRGFGLLERDTRRKPPFWGSPSCDFRALNTFLNHVCLPEKSQGGSRKHLIYGRTQKSQHPTEPNSPWVSSKQGLEQGLLPTCGYCQPVDMVSAAVSQNATRTLLVWRCQKISRIWEYQIHKYPIRANKRRLLGQSNDMLEHSQIPTGVAQGPPQPN